MLNIVEGMWRKNDNVDYCRLNVVKSYKCLILQGVCVGIITMFIIAVVCDGITKMFNIAWGVWRNHSNV